MLQAGNEPKATMRSASLVDLRLLLASKGTNLNLLCRRVGIGVGLLSEMEGRLPVRHFVALLEEAAHASGDDALGLHLGSSQGLDSLGVLGSAIITGPDIASVIANASRYFFVHKEGAHLDRRLEGQDVLITYCVREEGVLNYRQDAELSMAKMMNIARIATGRRNWTPSAVYFEHPEPRDSSEHRRIFRAPIYFSQPCNALVTPRRTLAMPVRGSDPDSLRQLQSLANAYASKHLASDDLLACVRQHIMGGLRAGSISIHPVAEALGTSERTLQRRLGERGLAFNALVENVRRELAKYYLQQDHLTLTEIGYLLGYSELSAFSRAFRRWTGVSPIEFRGRTSIGTENPAAQKL
jgi:AraC-like DNA-binding protein